MTRLIREPQGGWTDMRRYAATERGRHVVIWYLNKLKLVKLEEITNSKKSML